MLLTLNWSLMHIKMKSIQHVKQNTCNLWHLPKGRFTWSFDQMAAVVVFWGVCAVVHERFTPCLLQNKVVSCSMRLNLFCLDTRLHNTDNEPFTCQLLIKIMQILTNVSTKGGSCNPCFQWGLGLGWSRRHPREMDSPFQVASGLTSVFAIPCHMATTCRDK